MRSTPWCVLFVLFVTAGCMASPIGAPPTASDSLPAATSSRGASLAGAPRYDVAASVFEARVVGVQDAGRYVYVELDRGSERAWLVTVGPALVDVGDHAAVAVFGRAKSFPSRRLGRRFDDLCFGAATRLGDWKEMTWNLL